MGFLSLSKQFNLTEDFHFQNLLTSYQDFDIEIEDEINVNRNGLIGNPLLERFHVYIDYVSEKLYLKPNKKKYNKSFKYDKSGLVLYAFGPKLDSYYVKNVIEGSPAEKAGIMAGDKLVRVGWLPAKALSLLKIYKKFQRKPGTSIKLVVERNGTIHKRKLILEDLFKN